MNVSKISKILRTHPWSIQDFNGTPLYLLYVSAKTGWMLKKNFGHDYTHFFYLCPTNRVRMYYDVDDWKILGKDFFKKIRDIKTFQFTSPDYITALRKASVIITDIGGLNSHAAIVSRELKIPCIVGTKFATQIFKDGDLVEVDANTGIVRKLN